MATINQLLGTKDRKKQEEIIEKLVQEPPASVMIYFDGVRGTLQVQGAPHPLPVFLVKHILQRALETIIAQETEANIKAQAEQDAPAEPDSEGSAS